jgi:hypothetical protein
MNCPATQPHTRELRDGGALARLGAVRADGLPEQAVPAGHQMAEPEHRPGDGPERQIHVIGGVTGRLVAGGIGGRSSRSCGGGRSAGAPVFPGCGRTRSAAWAALGGHPWLMLVMVCRRASMSGWPGGSA